RFIALREALVAQRRIQQQGGLLKVVLAILADGEGIERGGVLRVLGVLTEEIGVFLRRQLEEPAPKQAMRGHQLFGCRIGFGRIGRLAFIFVRSVLGAASGRDTPGQAGATSDAQDESSRAGSLLSHGNLLVQTWLDYALFDESE